MKIVIQQSDLKLLESAGIIKNVHINTAWNRLCEKCPVFQEKEAQNSSSSSTNTQPSITIPSLQGNYDDDNYPKYDITIAYSLENGYKVASDIEKELQRKGINACLAVDGGFDAHRIEKRVANSTALVVILTQHCLKQPEVLFAMTAAKYYFLHPSLVILVHDAGSCFFPGYDEQPDSLKEFFSEKAVTFLSCYTKEGIREIAAKFESEKVALKNSIASQRENPKNALLQFLSKKEDQKEISTQEIQRRMKSIMPEQQLKEIIAKADVNNDGTVDSFELANLLQDLKLEVQADSPQQEAQNEDLTTRVFLSHKRSTGQAVAGRLYEGLKTDYKVFIDSEAKFKIHNLRQIVESTEVLVFILSHGILQSKWCLEELKSALDFKKKVIVVRELSYTLPAVLPPEWQCVENVLNTPDVLVWIAEYNAACIEALKFKIGPSDEVMKMLKSFQPEPHWMPEIDKLYQEKGIVEVQHELMMYSLPYNLEEIRDFRINRKGIPQSPGPEDVKYLAMYMKNLEVLEFSCAARLTAKNLEPLAVNCSNLKSLKMVSGKFNDITFFKDLAKYWTKLESLNISKSGLINSSALSEFTSLKHLIIRDNWQIQRISDWTNLDLETLDMTGCNRCGDPEARVIGANFKNLKVLSVANFLKLTDEGMKALTNGAFNLRVLSVSTCTELTDDAIDMMTQRWPDLEQIELKELSELTNKSMKFIGERCPKLTTLNLNGCKGINDEGIAYLATGCPKLRVLNLATTGVTDNCFSILGQHGIQLEALQLNNEKFNDSAIQNLAACCMKLTRLEIFSAPNFTNDAFKDIETILPNLSVCSLFGCSLVNEKAIEHWKKLDKLTFFYCQGVNYEEMKDKVKNSSQFPSPFLDPLFMVN